MPSESPAGDAETDPGDDGVSGGRVETSGGDAATDDDPATAPVVLDLEPGRDRDLLVDALGDHYEVAVAEDPARLREPFDCCVLDRRRFAEVGDLLRRRRADSDVVLPVVVLLAGDSPGADDPSLWEYADDVVTLPTARAALLSRVGNLVERRRAAVELQARTDRLAETVEDLRLKERAIDEAPVGLTITDTGDRDNAIVYANEQFERLTGYEESEILGRDHRILQGEDTDPAAAADFRSAIEERRHTSVDVLNYRKDGRRFWNKVDLAPLCDDDGEVTNFVGFQSDITDRKIRERRLEVLNRVLSHNLRNKMTVIEGHAELLERRDDGEADRSVAEIVDAAEDLTSLAETVREIERTVPAAGPTDTAIDLDQRIRRVVTDADGRYPDAAVDLDLPEDGLTVEAGGLATAVAEVVENALQHNPAPSPWVGVTARRRGDDWVAVEVDDDGPGIPDHEVDVLDHGETPLKHADRLGLWLVEWIVEAAGGEVTVDADDDGTTVSLAVPGAVS
jgi:PAS domain S-box-containing protein